MKTKLLLILLAICLLSCRNRDKLLTQDGWILNSRTVFDRASDSMYTIHFEKRDSIITIKFSNEGLLGVKEQTKPAHLTEWEWNDGKYDQVFINVDGEIRRYDVNQLNEESLSLQELDWRKNVPIDHYRKGNSKDWDVDSLERSRQTYYDPEKHGKITFK